jgi:hypothetical protein
VGHWELENSCQETLVWCPQTAYQSPHVLTERTGTGATRSRLRGGADRPESGSPALPRQLGGPRANGVVGGSASAGWPIRWASGQPGVCRAARRSGPAVAEGQPEATAERSVRAPRTHTPRGPVLCSGARPRLSCGSLDCPGVGLGRSEAGCALIPHAPTVGAPGHESHGRLGSGPAEAGHSLVIETERCPRRFGTTASGTRPPGSRAPVLAASRASGSWAHWLTGESSSRTKIGLWST